MTIEEISKELAQQLIQNGVDEWRRKGVDQLDVVEQEDFCTNSSINSLNFEYDDRAVSQAQKEQITDVCGFFRQKYIEELNSKYR